MKSRHSQPQRCNPGPWLVKIAIEEDEEKHRHGRMGGLLGTLAGGALGYLGYKYLPQQWQNYLSQGTTSFVKPFVNQFMTNEVKRLNSAHSGDFFKDRFRPAIYRNVGENLTDTMGYQLPRLGLGLGTAALGGWLGHTLLD